MCMLTGALGVVIVAPGSSGAADGGCERATEMEWPLNGPDLRQSQNFSTGPHAHPALDLVDKTAPTIHAAAGGVVVLTFANHEEVGNTIWIASKLDPGDGGPDIWVTTEYLHMQSPSDAGAGSDDRSTAATRNDRKHWKV